MYIIRITFLVHINSLFDDEIDNFSQYINNHIKKVNSHNTSIAHPIGQALMSTSMLDKYKFNVIALTETWLQGKKYQQNYVQITECNTVFKNETDK